MYIHIIFISCTGPVNVTYKTRRKDWEKIIAPHLLSTGKGEQAYKQAHALQKVLSNGLISYKLHFCYLSRWFHCYSQYYNLPFVDLLLCSGHCLKYISYAISNHPNKSFVRYISTPVFYILDIHTHIHTHMQSRQSQPLFELSLFGLKLLFPRCMIIF